LKPKPDDTLDFLDKINGIGNRPSMYENKQSF